MSPEAPALGSKKRTFMGLPFIPVLINTNWSGRSFSGAEEILPEKDYKQCGVIIIG